MRSRVLVLIAALIQWHCSSADNIFVPYDAPDLIDSRTVETLPISVNVFAGGVAQVRCVIRRDGEWLQNEIPSLLVEPAPRSISTEADGSASFVAEVSGEYRARCGTSDGIVVDQRGVGVHVTALAPITMDTALAAPEVQLGVAVQVTCSGFDPYGNPSLPSDVDLQVPEGALGAEADIETRYRVRGLALGEQQVACRYGHVVDATPATLWVRAGLPYSIDTEVSKLELAPAEVTPVTCIVRDALGNALEGIATEVRVLQLTGSGPRQRPDLIYQRNFSSTEAMTYAVYCTMPALAASDTTPVEVVVNAGLAHTWVIQLPEQDCYWQGRALPFDVRVFDRYGNTVPDPRVHVYSTSGPGFSVDYEAGVRLLQEADYVVVFELLDPKDDDSSIQTMAIPLRADSTPPRVKVLNMDRGAMLETGNFDPSPVTWSMSASDGLSGVRNVMVNGQSHPEHARDMNTVTWSIETQAPWGLSSIWSTVDDACGNRTLFSQSVMRSPAYYGVTTQNDPASHVTSGVMARLRQEVLDDSNRNDLDDLATVAEHALERIDFNKVVPPGTVLVDKKMDRECDGFWGKPEYSFLMSRWGEWPFIMGKPKVTSARFLDNGLHFGINAGPISFPIDIDSLRSYSCEFWLPTDISLGDHRFAVEADNVRADIEFTIGVRDGKAYVASRDVDLDTDGLTIDFDCPGWIDWLCDGFGSIVGFFAKNAIEKAVEKGIASKLPDVLTGFIDNFSIAKSIDLPSPLQGALVIQSGLDEAAFTTSDGGYGDLGLHMQVHPKALAVNMDPPKGPVRGRRTFHAFRPEDRAPFAIALSDDVLNQVLWSIWAAGGFEITDLTSVMNVGGRANLEGVEVNIKAMLPPVVMPGDAAYPFHVAMGDVLIEAWLDPGVVSGRLTGQRIRVFAYLSAQLAGDIRFDPVRGSLSTNLRDAPSIYVDVVELDDMGYQARVSSFLAELFSIAMPSLLHSVIGSVPLPVLNISKLIGLDGPGAQWCITDGDIRRAEGDDYVTVYGSLREGQ